MWGPGAEASPGNMTFNIVPASATAWNLTIDEREVENVPLFGDYGIGFDGSTSGSVGIDANMWAGGGTVDVDAPMSVTLDFPQIDSYSPGDVISIGSGSPVVRSTGASITTQPPSATIGLSATASIAAEATAEICVATCVDVNFFEPVNETGTYNIIQLGTGSLSIAGITVLEFDPGEVEVDFVTEFITGIGGTFGIPDPSLSTTVSSGSIVGTGSHDDYIDLELDVDKWFTRLGGGAPWGFSVPNLGQGVYGGYELVDIDLEFNVSHDQEFTFTPGDVAVTLDFLAPVEYWIYDGASLVGSGTSASVTYVAGQRIDMIAPSGDVSVTPSFALITNTFGNETESTFDSFIATKALELDLHWPGVTIAEDFYWEPHWHADLHWHESDWHCHDRGADGGCYVWAWHQHGLYYHDHGGYENHYSDLVAAKTDIHEGPVYDQSHLIDSTVDTSLFDQDRSPWTLQGFSPAGGIPFQLNPQQVPVADISGSAATTEGTLVTFDGSGSFDPDGSPITYDWDFGDGTSSFIGPIVDHIYADDGDYTVSLTVHDGHGPSPAAEHDIAVANAPPTIVVRPNLTTDEGTVISIDPTTFNDPGSLDTHTAMIDWGDGSPPVAGAVTSSPTGPPGLLGGVNGSVSGNHAYGDEGVYTVEVTIKDDENATASGSFVVTVENVAPTIEVGGNQDVEEGELVVLDPSVFNDSGSLDTHVATIDWGDGSAVDSGTISLTSVALPGLPGGVDGTVSGMHVYADGGPYIVEVEIDDLDGGVTSDTFTVTVINAPPVVDAGSDTSVAEGSLFTLPSALFIDPGTADTHTATIDWGDGSPVVAGTVTESPTGPPGNAAGLTGDVDGSHTYADNGVFTVTVEVIDNDGGSQSDSIDVTVTNVGPSLTPSGEPEVIIFDPFTIDSAFSDPGFDCLICPAPAPGPLALLLPGSGTYEEFSVSIDWDDDSPDYTGSVGHVSGGPAVATTGVVGATHTFAWIGTYFVEVTLTDDDGGTASFTHEVEVLGGHELNVEARRILTPFEDESKNLQKALKELDDVIDGDYWEGGKLWIDEVHLQSKHGHKVFSDQKKTVDKLAKILKDDAKGKGKKYVPLSPEAVEAINEAIYLILVSDQVLTQIAIEEAESTPVSDPKKQKSVDKELATAREELAKAQAELDKDHLAHAIDHYRKAWEHALKASKHASPPKFHVGHGDDGDN